MEEEFDTELFDHRGRYLGWWRVGYSTQTDGFIILYPNPGPMPELGEKKEAPFLQEGIPPLFQAILKEKG